MARPTSRALLASLLALLSGCPDKGADTTDDATAGTTDDEGTTPTTGGDDGEWTCEDFARADVMCFDGDVAELTAECEDGLAYIERVLGAECRKRHIEYAICIATSPCMPGDACAAEEAALDCEPPAGTACAAQADKLFMCGQTPSAAETGSQCQLELNAYNEDDPACGTAFEAFVACQATIACEDLANSVGCEAEAMAFGSMCPVGDE